MPLMRRLTFLLFPASLLAVAAVAISWIVTLGLSPWLLAAVAGLAVLCVLWSLWLQGEVRRTCEAEVVRERVRALEDQERVSMSYQERVVADEEEIRKVRRDVAREVARARDDIARRNGAAASESLSQALALMGDAALRQCEHPSADAMASMKARACREAGVDAQFALEIPRDLTVSSVDLCAVLGNLADNGLAAAMRARDEARGGEGAAAQGARGEAGASQLPTAGVSRFTTDVLRPAPYLRLRSVVRDGYLVITAQNPLSAADEAALSEKTALRGRRRSRSATSHGWGLSIVSSIAARYDGEFITEAAEGAFKATVALKLEPAGGEAR